MQTHSEQKQDHGGKGLSQAGRDFFIRNLVSRGLSAFDPGGGVSIVEISAPTSARIWVKTLERIPCGVYLSGKSEWEFYGRILVVVANIDSNRKEQPDAVIYALSEHEAKALANGGNSISESNFREWIRGRDKDEWWEKLRGAIGVAVSQ